MAKIPIPALNHIPFVPREELVGHLDDTHAVGSVYQREVVVSPNGKGPCPPLPNVASGTPRSTRKVGRRDHAGDNAANMIAGSRRVHIGTEGCVCDGGRRVRRRLIHRTGLRRWWAMLRASCVHSRRSTSNLDIHASDLCVRRTSTGIVQDDGCRTVVIHAPEPWLGHLGTDE